VTEVDLVRQDDRAAKDPRSQRPDLMKARAARARGLRPFAQGDPSRNSKPQKTRTPYFSCPSAKAKRILEMRLSRLTGLEQDKLATEYGELCDTIARSAIGAQRREEPLDVIVMELEEIRAKLPDKRRTEIVATSGDHPRGSHPRRDMIVTVSHAATSSARARRPTGLKSAGVAEKIGMEAAEEDWNHQLFVAFDPRVRLLLLGQGQSLREEGVRESRSPSDGEGTGRSVNLVGMEPGEKIAAIVEVPKVREGYIPW